MGFATAFFPFGFLVGTNKNVFFVFHFIIIFQRILAQIRRRIIDIADKEKHALGHGSQRWLVKSDVREKAGISLPQALFTPPKKIKKQMTTTLISGLGGVALSATAFGTTSNTTSSTTSNTTSFTTSFNTGISRGNYESFQVLKYDIGQAYAAHHDYGGG